MQTSIAEMARNSRLHAWYEDIQEQKKSGITVAEWCKEQGYAEQTFYYRKRQVREVLDKKLQERKPENVEVAALPVPVEKENKHKACIQVRIAGIEVEIPSGSSPETIQAVLKAI